MASFDFQPLEISFEENCFRWNAGADLKIATRDWKSNVLPLLRKRVQSDNISAERYQQLMESSYELVNDLFQALHSNWCEPEEKEAPKVFWRHWPVQLFRLNDATRGISVNRPGVLDVAATYLNRPELQSNRLDWVLLDSLVFSQLETGLEEVALTRGGRGTNWAYIIAQENATKYYALTVLFSIIGFALNHVAPLILAVYLFLHDHQIAAIVTIGVTVLWELYLLLTWPSRRKARRKVHEWVTRLEQLHRILGDSTISPRRLRQALDEATTAGVVVDGAVFAIVDRLIQ
jgi:hypothetical protein